MSFLKNLVCKECKREYEPGAVYVCEYCFGPLEAQYDYDAIASSVSRAKIQAGPLSIWRYRDFLPVTGNNYVSLCEGMTPLLKADRLAKKIGLKNVYVKNDSVNPTFSFKDRVVSVATTRAKELGFDTLACASTGNLAGAVAAYANVAGMQSYIFIPSDLEQGKVIGCGIYQPNVIAIKGNYDDVNRLCSELYSVYKWAFVNINMRPYYSEGSKTLGFEVAEQLGWRAPDRVVVPVASGSLMTKVYKGLNEFSRLGLIGKVETKICGAQAEGCSPVATAFRNKTDFIKPVKPNTIAKSIAIGNPADGYYALDIARKTGGCVEAVTEEEIIDGIKLLAGTEGVFTETAGGVTIAVLKKLAEAGKIDKDELVVVYVTGNGLKTQEALMYAIPKIPIIEPTLAAFQNIQE
ncbi:MAG: threonine synthase [Planctomycetes bacterium]|nr:threonine synthase [Planctomycetota bacterium]